MQYCIGLILPVRRDLPGIEGSAGSGTLRSGHFEGSARLARLAPLHSQLWPPPCGAGCDEPS